MLLNSLFAQASSRPSPAPSTNMAGRINDRKLMTLARIHTTPALQGKEEINVNIHSLKNKFELNALVGRHYNLIQCEKITF